MAQLRPNIRWTAGGITTLVVLLALAIGTFFFINHYQGITVGIVGALLLLLVGSIATGILYQHYANQRDKLRNPAPGDLLDIDGRRMHIQSLGDAYAPMSILFENGTAGVTSQWGWIAPEAATLSHVVLYDRPGQGWSQSLPGKADAKRVIQQFHTILEMKGFHPPYILVGHALGGLFCRLFAQEYPGEVVGMVLIDPRPERVEDIFPAGWLDRQVRINWWLSLASRLGLLRLSGLAEQVESCLPERQAAEAIAFLYADSAPRTWREELALAVSAGKYLIETPNPLKDLPLVVLSAGQPDSVIPARVRSKFTERHKFLAGLSSRGRHRVVEEADHFSIILAEEHGKKVAEAIRDVYEEVNNAGNH